jgi:lipopolysaccharide heptosyltransferase II
MSGHDTAPSPASPIYEGWAEDWKTARSVLAVRLDNMGDVLMTTPALRALKESHPQRHLALLTSRSGAHAAAHIPEIDDVIVYDAPWVRHEHDIGADADLAMIERLRRRCFDGAAIFTVYSQSALPAALFCRLAGIPRRLAHSRENPYGLLTHRVVETEPQRQIRHEVRRQLDLVAATGAKTSDERLSFRIGLDAHDIVADRLAFMGIDARAPWILIHPGATAESRRYPAERFAAVADALSARLRCPIVFAGSAAEAPLVEGIRTAMRAPSYTLAGVLSLGECAAAVAQAHLLIANNSGPVHLAAAVGTPVVDLYALTNPQHMPWRVPHRTLSHDVPCKYCYRSVCPQGHHACLRGVSVEEVIAAALALFGAKPRGERVAAAGDSFSTSAGARAVAASM